MKVVFEAPMRDTHLDQEKFSMRYHYVGNGSHLDEFEWRRNARRWAADNLEFPVTVSELRCIFGSMDDAILFRLNFS